MRLLINALSARLGGGQTYVANLLAHTPPDWQVFILCQDGLDLSRAPKNVTRITTRYTLQNPFVRAGWELLFLPHLVRKLKADALFAPGGLLPPLPVAAKTIVTFQNMLPFDPSQRTRYTGYRRLRDWLLERGLGRSMRKADLVIFISRFAQSFIAEKLGALRGASVVIPHGIDARFFPDAPLPLPAYMPQGDYFLYVSFIDYYKSQIELVHAFSEVKKRSGTTATLVLAGAQNPAYGALLQGEITRLGLSENVRLLGNVAHHDLPALYQHARINLFASCTENCPNILLEMMASGTPALVSDRGPMPEFGGDDVIYFNPGDEAQLAGHWLAMLDLPHPSQHMAQNARARMRAMTWENAAQASWRAMAGLL